jgi:hypothetical protein
MDADLDVLLPQTAYLGGDAATRDELAAAFRQRSGTLGSGAASQVYGRPTAAARVAVIDSVGFADAACCTRRRRRGSATAWRWRSSSAPYAARTTRN